MNRSHLGLIFSLLGASGLFAQRGGRGDALSISHGGKIVDAFIKAILDTTDGLKCQVD